MPITISCPYCNQVITTPDEQAGQVINCSVCKKPMRLPVPVASDVPILEEVNDDPFAIPSEGAAIPYRRRVLPIHRSKTPDSESRSHMWFFLAVAGLVAVVMILFIYDRADRYYAKKRIQGIREELIQLDAKLSIRETEVKAKVLRKKATADDPFPDYYEVERKAVERDAECKRLSNQISELEFELKSLLREHPEFR